MVHNLCIKSTSIEYITTLTSKQVSYYDKNKNQIDPIDIKRVNNDLACES